MFGYGIKWMRRKRIEKIKEGNKFTTGIQSD